MLKINSSLRILGLAVIGAVAAASQAHAQTADVIFTGAKGVTCTVQSVAPGSLNANAANTTMEGAGGLTAVSGGGTAGNVVVNCTGDSLVTVSSPVQVSAPAGFTAVTSQSVVEWNGSNTSMKVGPDNIAGGGLGWEGLTTTALLLNPTTAGTDQTLNVGMAVQGATGSTLPNGTYEYAVTVTIASN